MAAKHITVPIPEDIHAALKAHAQANRRSLVGQMLWALEEYAARPVPQRPLPEREPTSGAA